ncbi:hypothetical protein L486_01342 [Kwoniella mangroviensis CBS 10435]|uniref:Uncharacterized protein n=1 Tax=Kwoniella mangroviensis CBS 10435 TaxID=1331196 RepID=A0A1B9J204_9TREE|nr:hypothetical protein L486_01342 [Kwoniella mangroviensis CBS 10435]
MADRDSSANNSRYSRSTEGIPQFGSFGPLPAGQRTTVSSNPQRVTEDTLTQYLDEQSKNYDRSQREIEALTASSSSRAQNTSSVPNSGAEGGEIWSDHDPGNVAGSTDLTTTGGGLSIDPPSYDQQKKE